METFLSSADAVIAILRTALLSIAVVFGAICVLDWAVRTRKISPFNAIARFCRTTVDPIIAPIERRVMRAGGSPASAALWALVADVVGGILLLTLFDIIRLEVVRSIIASQEGTAGIFHLLVRWSYRLSEPVLQPLRRIVPVLGGLDITPIVAYILLGLLESLLFRLM